MDWWRVEDVVVTSYTLLRIDAGQYGGLDWGDLAADLVGAGIGAALAVRRERIR